MKIIVCPHCGKPVMVNGLGRKRLNHSVKNVYDAVADSSTVVQAAEKLGCSRGYIYKVLKQHGMTPAEVIKGHATKDTSLLYKGATSGGR